MTRFGYTLMTEQSGPRELVGYARAAEERGFDLVADLDDRDVGEAGLPVRRHGVDDRVEVRSAGDRVCDVVGCHEPRSGREAGRRRKVGVYGPASPEPAELVVGTLRRGVLVRIPADRYLADRPPGVAGAATEGQRQFLEEAAGPLLDKLRSASAG